MRVLVVGYGNPSRRDDGVALAVVNGLRARLGQPPLDAAEDGFDQLGAATDTLFLQQLTPELAETLAAYDKVWFVDAHLGIDPVRRVPLSASLHPALVTHHFKPEALLALAGQLYGHAPAAELLSVRGVDFDFGETLSADTAAGAEQALDTLWRTLAAGAAGASRQTRE